MMRFMECSFRSGSKDNDPEPHRVARDLDAGTGCGPSAGPIPRVRPPARPPQRPAGDAPQTSIQIVTGPSLTSATCISAPNRPVSTAIPCPRSASAKCA